MNKILIACGIGYIILLTGLKLLYDSYVDLNRDWQQVTKELSNERLGRIDDREKFKELQGVVDNAAKQKQQSDKTTAALREALSLAQKGSPCAGVPVPDAVTKQLRERAAQINATSTSPK